MLFFCFRGRAPHALLLYRMPPKRYRVKRRKEAAPGGGGGDLSKAMRNLALGATPTPRKADGRHELEDALTRLRLDEDAEAGRTTFEDDLRRRQRAWYHDNSQYHGMGCAVCRNNYWLGRGRPSS